MVGMLSDGWFDFSVGFVLDLLSSRTSGDFKGVEDETEVSWSPRSKKELRGTLESLCLQGQKIV